MNDKKLKTYYLLSSLGILAASAYPLYMGVRVVSDMITAGAVMKEDYPKYIIPYTPISLALLAGVWMMPLLLKYIKKGALFLASAISVGVFLTAELLLESQVIVNEVKLQDWQMYMCIYPIPPGVDTYRQTTVSKTAVEILMGDYDPAFKLHFYAISILLILGALGVFYGFARVIQGKDHRNKKVLTMQAASLGIFLALCVLACFTAFFRDGNLKVPVISAILMTVFFIFFGVTAGLYAASFLTGKSRRVFVGIPAVVASLMTTLMYVGEMILLDGYLYRFGQGFFFRGLWKAPAEYYPEELFSETVGTMGLAPVDILIILASGLICGWILRLWGSRKEM